MTYNPAIYHQQGGSELTVGSTGSLVVAAGGTISGAGTIQTTGAITANGGITTTGATTTASLTVSNGGAFFLGSNVQIFWAASAAAPSGLPVSASPGAVFFRSDGANSAGYVNTSTGAAGSVWTIFAEL